MIEKRKSQELMSLLGLKDTLNGLARASGVLWHGHALRRDNGDVLRRALDFKVAGRRGRGRPNVTWKRQVEGHTNRISLKRETKWRNGNYKLSGNMRRIQPSALTQTKPDLKKRISLISLMNAMFRFIVSPARRKSGIKKVAFYYITGVQLH